MKRLIQVSLMTVLVLAAGSVFGHGRIYDGDMVVQTGGYVRYVCVADINNDGIPDLVTASNEYGEFSVNVGYANGTFRECDEYEVTSSYEGFIIGTGDLNGDDYDDIIIGYYDNSVDSLGVYLNNGDGTFGTYAVYEMTNSTSDIETADIDGDTHLDVLVATADHISVFKNNGDGTLAPRVDYGAGSNWNQSVVAVDIDGDSDLDMVTVDLGNDSLWILTNDGTGGFDSTLQYYAGDRPYEVTAGRFDNDDYPDLAIAVRNSETVSIFINNGDGTFADSAIAHSGIEAGAVRAVDLDDDGYDDLVAAGWFPEYPLQVLMCDGDGTFTAGNTYVAPSIWSIATGDFDHDGIVDVAVQMDDAYAVRIMLGDGAGGLGSDLPGYETGTQSWGVATGELNGDTYPDFVVANTSSDDVSVFLNNGDSTFSPGVNYACGDGPRSVLAVDVNNDTHIDIVTGNHDADGVSVLLNNGDGTYGGLTHYSAGDRPKEIVAAHLNSDGFIDLAAASYYEDWFAVMLNNGDGSFAAPVYYDTDRGLYGLAVADLDGDLDIDMIPSGNCLSGNKQTVWLNDGAGIFTEGTDTMVFSGHCFDAVAGDLDDDGDNDIVYSDSDEGVYVMLNNGDATFEDAIRCPVGFDHQGMIIADIDHKGGPDLLSCAGYNGFFSIYKNYGAAYLTELTSFGFGKYNFGVAAADFDGDGDLDVVAPSSTASATDTAFIFWNRLEQVPVGIDNDDSPLLVPHSIVLRQNYPNPFNPATTIEYSLPNAAHVTILIYNVLGQQVRTLVDQTQAAGPYTIEWDGQNDIGKRVSTGVYFYRLDAEGSVETKKMLLLK